MTDTNDKKVMAGMSFREKMEYLWTYYKWVIAVVAVAAVLLGFAGRVLLTRQVEILYSGILVNMEVSQEGQDYLSHRWFEVLGGKENRQRVDLDLTGDPTEDNITSLQISAVMVDENLDYLILDEASFRYFHRHGSFSPLEQMLTPDQLERLDTMLVYEEGEDHPFAIDISQTAFAKDCIRAEGRVYLAFPGNTPRTERNPLFLDFLLDW